MNTNNEIFTKAFNRLNGDYLEDINQLQAIKFDKNNMDELVTYCEAYHIEKSDQESFKIVGEYQFKELECTAWKWTNPFYWIYAILYVLYAFGKSLFITAKDFKK